MELSGAAIEEDREQADYDAHPTSPQEARQAIELARRFLAAVDSVSD